MNATRRLISLICLNILLFRFHSNAQGKLKPLQVGDTIPNLQLKMVNYKSKTLFTNALKGKFLILDLWMTSCAPCIQSLPTFSKLERKYKNKLVILPVTFEDKSAVMRVLNMVDDFTKVNIYSVTNDRAIYEMFPPQFNPYYVWIDQKGVVVAIGKEFNEGELKKYLPN
jgi:thiol-disulfide isomerase/thioredoxin